MVEAVEVLGSDIGGGAEDNGDDDEEDAWTDDTARTECSSRGTSLSTFGLRSNDVGAIAELVVHVGKERRARRDALLHLHVAKKVPAVL